MNRIVEESGLSKGSIYWHFRSKDDLFHHVMHGWHTALMNTIHEGMEARRTAPERLRVIVLSIGRRATACPGLFRAQLEFYASAGCAEEFSNRMRTLYDESLAAIRRILEEGMAGGEFRRGPVEPLSRQIKAALDGALLRQEILPDDEDPARWNALANSFLALLAA